MPTIQRVPPGRAGRLWLVHRIGVAERGADQLERKVQILSTELARRHQIAEQCRREWIARCRTAELWVLRAGMICGQDGVRHAFPPQQAQVHVESTTTIGVRHPTDAAIEFPDVADVALGSAALVSARAATTAALRAGIDSAVAEAAIAALEDALVAARRRARILRNHWVPQLQARLRELQLALEQAEQEDHARLQRVIG